MRGIGRDDIATVGLYVDAGTNVGSAGNMATGMLEVEVGAPRAAPHFEELRKSARQLVFELGVALVTAISWVDIYYNQSRDSTRRNADIGSRPLCPPILDLLRINRGILYTVLRTRMLAGRSTIGVSTRAKASVSRMQWEN